MKCQNCKEKLEKGEQYKLVDKKPVCGECWDVYEEHLKEARDWLELDTWDNQEILTC